MLTMLGIPNCDTIRKAKKYLEAHEIDYQFHDIRKQPLDGETWRKLAREDQEGKLVNTRGPSFRKLGITGELNEDTIVEVLTSTPTAMKRPVMLQDGALQSIGFSEAIFARYLS